MRINKISSLFYVFGLILLSMQCFYMIYKGLENKDYIIITDRVKAIKHALEKAKEGDIVLIAGKGPENEQIYQNRVIHHNDEEVVKNILMER